MDALTVIWVLAVALCAAALLWMAGLILLRLRHARRTARRRADRSRVEAALVGILQGAGAAEGALRPYAGRARLMAETLLEFMGLVRGADRERVLEVLAGLGVPATLRARLRRGSLAGRMASAEALSVFPSPETEAALDAAASEGAPAAFRLAALRSLDQLGEGVPLRRLLAELEAGRLRPTPVVGELVRSIVARRPQAAVRELRAGAAHEAVQAMLVEGLGASGDYGALGPLLEVATAPSAEVRAAVQAALGRLMHPAAAGAVAAGLEDPAPQVRAAAAQAAGDARFMGLAAALEARLADPAWRVRHLAAAALVRLGEEGRERLRRAAAQGGGEGAQTAVLVLAEEGLAA